MSDQHVFGQKALFVAEMKPSGRVDYVQTNWKPWCFDVCQGMRTMAFKESPQCDKCPYLNGDKK